ncbi:zinc finger, CCHC-type containing protein [Tanacetum coccineum]|uniref:Zinc finger, CCHC-type containing protein n=1 Tax=Tanacetum coccineum TaxID=301880 RepID=A0ABQ5D717_9ASTR
MPISPINVKDLFNGDLSETVYMHHPPGFVDARFPSHVCRLQRSLYGLKQAPRAWFQVIMEYLVNISKRRAFWSLNEDILKITILKTNTSYPSRKIRRIRACTHQRPQRNKAQYAVSREDQYAILEIWNEYNIMEDIKCGPTLRNPQYAVSNPWIRHIEPTSRPYK